MSGEELRGWYLLLDSDNRPLTRGHMESPPDSPSIEIKVPREKMKVVLEHEELELVSLEENGENLLGRILLRRGDSIFLEKIKRLGAEIRENLRMPVKFDSFIYPCPAAGRGATPSSLWI